MNDNTPLEQDPESLSPFHATSSKKTTTWLSMNNVKIPINSIVYFKVEDKVLYAYTKYGEDYYKSINGFSKFLKSIQENGFHGFKQIHEAYAVNSNIIEIISIKNNKLCFLYMNDKKEIPIGTRGDYIENLEDICK